ncbi:flavin-containing monooxygenase [Arsenicibacter rosenii]|uniref:4-hydroxyacetophenone monooxygenase n=1 Tax=Arsenicibacter rosenii TaxID=1750698 RepID=A0A1S2VII0_9BACT|nr:NAD(P)/FAD-dependent oxidoreductase [Arsenicibacter rosenii]OIN57658.1 4-hydroxyacetophenone monooxygenase [Arsenicibacter rosenii]
MKTTIDVAVIGAGFAGIGAAIRLKSEGHHSFVVLERAASIGGTWRENTYPGCGCDIPSYLYSFSFAPSAAWSRVYAGQAEILAYLNDCVASYDLQPHLRFQTSVVKAVFSEAHGHWTLTTQRGEVITARVVISAIGALDKPAFPKINGMEAFQGTAFHSARWDHACDLRGKRVAVIGTGASAVQLVPEVAKVAGELRVFQRTAPYVMPRLDGPVPRFMQSVLRTLPVVQRILRESIYWVNEGQGLSFWGHKTLNRIGTWRALRHLHRQIADPALRRQLTPDYVLGCKRVLFSNDYYPALTRPNVSLVTERIAAITADSVKTQDGQEYPADVIIYSTGFQLAGGLFSMPFIGRNGRTLIQDWVSDGVSSLHGMAFSGYPNLLLLVGPNTGLGHNSIIHVIESQINYVLDYIRFLDRCGPDAALDVRPEVQQQYQASLQQRFSPTVWASGCRSWYMDKQGSNTALWPGSTMDYRARTRRINPNDFTVIHGYPEKVYTAPDDVFV